MTNYQVHPDSCGYGIELRDGQGVDDYIAAARGFRSTAQFIEYREASPKRQAKMRRERDKSADCGDQDRRRALELLRLK